MAPAFMDIFEQWAADYDSAVNGDNPEYKDVFANYSFMLEQAAAAAEGKVIEFGPGTGNLTRLLLTRGLDVTAIEPSRDMAVIGEEKTGIIFETGDFLNYSFDHADTIISSFAFHHLNDHEKEQAVSSYYPLLSDNGTIVILDTIFNSTEEKQSLIEYYSQLNYHHLVEDLNREYYPLKETMAAIARRQGFSYNSVQLNRFAHLQILKKKKFRRPSDLIGQTPLVELTSFKLKHGVRLFAKLEMYNPGGSIKDRLGKKLIEQALRDREISYPVVVEATAGNTGIGLALACQQHHLKLRVYVPEKFSIEKQQLMRALGAEIIHTPTSEGMLGARQQALSYAEATGAYYANQFENYTNPESYYSLADELLDELGTVEMIVAGAGSGGTFTGLADKLKPHTRTIIVEPEGSILNGGEPGSHRTEGIGVEQWPVFLNCELIDAVETISDEDAFRNVRQLAEQEGLLVGSSSGAALQAALNQIENSDIQGNIVVIFPDASDRYLSQQIYNS